MRDAARFRRARHRKQINPKTCAYQCPTTFCLTVDPPPSLRRFASRASAASARLSTASSPSTPASVATVPPWRCVRAPRGRREAPHFSPLRVAHDGANRKVDIRRARLIDRRSERFAHLQASPSLFFTNRSSDGTTLSKSSRTSTPPPSRRGWRRARSPRRPWARFSGSPSSSRSEPRRRLFRGGRPARHGHDVSS